MSIPNEAVEAAAKAMYEQRPHATDPAHWGWTPAIAAPKDQKEDQ